MPVTSKVIPMSHRMTFSETGFGMTQFANESIVLAGGMRSDKQGTRRTSRLRYDIYDRLLIAAGTPAVEAKVGKLEINVRPGGDVEGIVDIKIAPAIRRGGIGRRVIEALAASSADGLRVYDIKKAAVGFWRKVGCEFAPGRGGQLDGVMPVPAPAPEDEAVAPRM
jgi:GNAT superfamily N-acetyltransferase